jgi:hypothetical protein
MPPYPRTIKRKLLRINTEWHLNGLPEWLPFPEGNEEGRLRVHVKTPPGLFEQATEYHRRQALEKLARYEEEEPSPSLAKEIAEHMMYANLASQCLNQAFGQDPLKDLPFPID